jgi:catechol 2,3-dioxygenase-like lactoylglutathione lyase family enzyme
MRWPDGQRTPAAGPDGIPRRGQDEGVLRIGTVVVGVGDVHRAMAFWTAALGFVPRDEVRPEDDFIVLVPPDGRGFGLALDTSETPVQEHPRLHLDLYARDAGEQEAEVERLVGLGATLVDWDLYPEDPDFVVLADPDGNRFCVVDKSR